MLATHFLSKSISKTKIALPYQWLSITFLTIRPNSNSSNSGSSSSDSDSDSDSRNKNTKGKSKNLNYLQGALAAQKKRQIQKKVIQIAQHLNEASGHEKEKILETLLSTVSQIENDKSEVDQSMHKNKRTITEVAEKHQAPKKQIRTQSTLISDMRKIKYDRSAQPSRIKMLKNQKGLLTTDKIEKPQWRVTSERDEPSIVKMLKNQQRKERNMIVKIDVSEKVETNVTETIGTKQEKPREPSIIHMLRRQQRKKKIETNVPEETGTNVTETIETKQEERWQPSVIHMLRREKYNMFKESEERKVKRDFDDQLKQKYEGTGRRTFNKRYQASNEPSIANMLRHQGGSRRQTYEISEEETSIRLENQISLKKLLEFDNSKGIENTEFQSIFIGEITENPNIPALKVWNMCERRELEATVQYYPRNALEEMINWTNEGKLWQFPIDNEQGMEEEQKVHFSKHVFLERHLQPWCPTKGPIRHFMELVCCGLSKNPYLTIQEKQDHIMWYKDYFENKKDLLNKLGLVE